MDDLRILLLSLYIMLILLIGFFEKKMLTGV